MKVLFSILFSTFLYLNLKAQNNSIVNDCDDRSIVDSTLSDSLTLPIFTKGDSNLITFCKKYFYYTDTMLVLSNESRVIFFSIQIDKYGKIASYEFIQPYNLTNHLISNFSNFIRDIDHWEPALNKKTYRPAETYDLIFTLEINKESFVLTITNNDYEEIYLKSIARPIKA